MMLCSIWDIQHVGESRLWNLAPSSDTTHTHTVCGQRFLPLQRSWSHVHINALRLFTITESQNNSWDHLEQQLTCKGPFVGTSAMRQHGGAMAALQVCRRCTCD